MTDQDKKTIYIISGCAAAFLGYKMFFAQDSGGSMIDPTGNGGVSNPGTPGVGNFDAKVVATALYDAMKNSGTNEARILSVLRNVNQAQFGEVFRAFGKKSYNEQLGNQMNYSPLFSLPLENLQVWLESELSEDEYNIMYLKYPQYL